MYLMFLFGIHHDSDQIHIKYNKLHLEYFTYLNSHILQSEMLENISINIPTPSLPFSAQSCLQILNICVVIHDIYTLFACCSTYEINVAYSEI